MGEKQETIADIVAEMRRYAQGDTRHDRDIKCFADLIEFTYKREVGNGAKMREALLETTRQLEPIVKYMHPNKAEHIGLTTVFAACEPIYKIAKAALAAPPRNCDRFARYYDALETFMPISNPDGVVIIDFADWLFAPYEEGGAE